MRLPTLGTFLFSAMLFAASGDVAAQGASDDERVVVEYEALVRAEPGNAQYQFTLGVAYARVGRPLDAILLPNPVKCALDLLCVFLPQVIHLGIGR